MTARPTCLFTGQELDEHTKVEHTILDSLGGHITSQIVSSNCFNEQCGNDIDQVLADLYRPVFMALAPALSPRIDGCTTHYDEEGRSYTTRNGVTSMYGVEITERDAQGKPVKARGTVRALRRLAKSMKVDPDKIEITENVPLPVKVVYGQYPVVEPRAELSALKCAVLTFDHMLADQPEKRFTRCENLAPLREDIRRCVLDTKQVDFRLLHRAVLGLQLDRERQGRYEEILSWFPDYGREPFEHVLIAAAHRKARTLDIAWHVAGIEWQGFRLCSDWTGDDFTCVVINQILKGGTFHGPFWIDRSLPICKDTPFRSAPDNDIIESGPEHITHTIGEFRSEAYRRAVYHVEVNCDDELRDVLVRATRSEDCQGHQLLAGIVIHACRLYSDKVREHPDFHGLLAAFRSEATAFDGYVIPPGSEIPDIDWPACHVLYRALLKKLVARFGLPGHRFPIPDGIATETYQNDVAFKGIPKNEWRPRSS
jgi:hypothetical protein